MAFTSTDPPYKSLMPLPRLTSVAILLECYVQRGKSGTVPSNLTCATHARDLREI
jgi:hypothetical protein